MSDYKSGQDESYWKDDPRKYAAGIAAKKPAWLKELQNPNYPLCGCCLGPKKRMKIIGQTSRKHLEVTICPVCDAPSIKNQE